VNILDILPVVSRQIFLHILSSVSEWISSIYWRTSLGKLLQYFVGRYRINIVDILSFASRCIFSIRYRASHCCRFESNTGTNRLKSDKKTNSRHNYTCHSMECRAGNDTMEKIWMSWYIWQTQSKCEAQYAQKYPGHRESKVNKTGDISRSNIEEGSYYHCCSGKATSIRQHHCVCL